MARMNSLSAARGRAIPRSTTRSVTVDDSFFTSSNPGHAYGTRRADPGEPSTGSRAAAEARAARARAVFQQSGGKGSRGLGVSGLKRHRKVLRDNINGITKGDVRRMARRGGVKRISSDIYSAARLALRERLSLLLKQIVLMVEVCNRKTVTVMDVVWVLNRNGAPIYGFGEPEFGRHK
ncbi:histone-fold-containing protein [Trichodelitschia bisporula]|uniref:Histone H4 n=1 Tax=Trichodelitschia bisporula TaxID=703511 RepID=A0A6G1HKU6_9PEZI|nr:histone-fold-containing protein [Trichodelitschia bisporula]